MISPEASGATVNLDQRLTLIEAVTFEILRRGTPVEAIPYTAARIAAAAPAHSLADIGSRLCAEAPANVTFLDPPTPVRCMNCASGAVRDLTAGSFDHQPAAVASGTCDSCGKVWLLDRGAWRIIDLPLGEAQP
jgi:hypothetical protein